MATCNQCNQEIKWPVPYQKGNKPLNLDDSPHLCKQQKIEGNGGDAAKILEECSAFHNMFDGVECAKFESLAKIYISRMMRR